MTQTYQYSKMLTRSQTIKNNNASNNNVRRSPRFSSNVYSNITFEIEEHDNTVRPSKASNNRNNERSNNLDEHEKPEVVIRRSPRLASRSSASNERSNSNLNEDEEPEVVIRRSTRVAKRSNTSNASSNNLNEDEEPEVVIRRSTRLAGKACNSSNASNASNASSNNLDEDEEPEVLRRSQRLASKPISSFYKDIDQFFDLDNDEDDEDYTPKAELKVDIDFDEASRAWRHNKRPLGNGMFSYNTRSKV